jgi:2'-5' RNA ligase
MDMTDRWRDRPDPPPGQAQLYWHVLMRDQPQVRALAALARQRLAPCPGLHLTPEERLHLTVLRVGTSPEIPQPGIEDMVGRARELLAPVPPATVTIGRVLYHPEAIVLGAVPDGGLDPVATAIRSAASSAIGLPADVTDAPWLPHVTVAYSTLDQPAEPIIAALGAELPACPVIVDSVHLIAQYGPERDWNWRLLATARLAAA